MYHGGTHYTQRAHDVYVTLYERRVPAGHKRINWQNNKRVDAKFLSPF